MSTSLEIPRLRLKYSMPYTDIYKPLEFFGDTGTLTRISGFWCSFSTIGALRPLALQFGCATTRWWWCATTQNQQCWDQGAPPRFPLPKKQPPKQSPHLIPCHSLTVTFSKAFQILTWHSRPCKVALIPQPMLNPTIALHIHITYYYSRMWFLVSCTFTQTQKQS